MCQFRFLGSSRHFPSLRRFRVWYIDRDYELLNQLRTDDRLDLNVLGQVDIGILEAKEINYYYVNMYN